MTRLLIVGAGCAGRSALGQVASKLSHQYSVVGFLDDDPAKDGVLVDGVRVLGPVAQAPRLIRENSVGEVLVAIPSATGGTLRRIHEACASVRVRAIPCSASALTSVRLAAARRLRPEDLLRRDPVDLWLPQVKSAYEGKTVLVAGGAGSIGSELVKALTLVGANRIVVLDHHEPSMFATVRDVERETGFLVEPFLGSVTDEADVLAAFRCMPDVVLHAAAYKHVPMGEGLREAYVKNNVLGTALLTFASETHHVDRLVLVSTDKAVAPSSVMGTTKRACELVVRAMAGPHLKTATVRFGNVLGSSGSVVETFSRQIAEGGPVTVTDDRMTRYFMSVQEAAQLVLLAGALTEGHDTYVLDMGEPVTIRGLAEDMCRLSGMTPGVDIDVVVTGARPGEKLSESLVRGDEPVDRILGKVWRVGSTHPPPMSFSDVVATIRKHADDPAGLVRSLESAA